MSVGIEYAVARETDVPVGSHIVVAVNGREIGIFNVHGTLYALPNVCVHQNGPLCRGGVGGTLMSNAETNWKPTWAFDGEIVACPWHSIEYNIRTGQCLPFPEKRLPVYPVEVRDEWIHVRL